VKKVSNELYQYIFSVHQKNEKIAMENQHTDGSAGGWLGKKVVMVAVAGVRAK